MKKQLLLMLSVFLVVFSLVMVSADNTATLDLPAEDDSISGATYILGASLDTNTEQYTNATFWYDDGSSNITIGLNTTSPTLDATLFNYTWVTTEINDVDDLIVWVNITNATGEVSTMDSSTGVDIDNGNPTATLSSATIRDQTQKFSTQTFTIGLAADNAIGISSCIIYFTDRDTSAVVSATTTASGNACYNTTLSPSVVGLTAGHGYDFLVQATDGNGDQTNSSTRIIGYAVEEDGTPVDTIGRASLLSKFIDWIKGIASKIRSWF